MIAPLLPLIERNGTNFTRACHFQTGEKIWVKVHDDGSLTAANSGFDGDFDFGDTVILQGDETEDTWGTFTTETA